MSGETEKEILDILEKALGREKSSGDEYSRAAEIAENREVREVFTRLANEEKQHEKTVKELYYKYKKRLGLKILHTDDPD